MVKSLAFIVASSIVILPVLAQTMTEARGKRESNAYLQDGRGAVVRNPFGLCWRSGTWDPAHAVIGCDGQLTPPVANPTAPEPVAPAMPQRAQATPQAAPTVVPCDFEVTLANDETFDFNRATLGKAAQKRIDDQVISRLSACATVERLVVSGHADRLGAQKYNQRLSEKRASIVANYIREKQGFSKIEVFGHGETQPITSCENKLPRRALIDCLAPDRRVVIEIQGTAK